MLRQTGTPIPAVAAALDEACWLEPSNVPIRTKPARGGSAAAEQPRAASPYPAIAAAAVPPPLEPLLAWATAMLRTQSRRQRRPRGRLCLDLLALASGLRDAVLVDAGHGPGLDAEALAALLECPQQEDPAGWAAGLTVLHLVAASADGGAADDDGWGTLDGLLVVHRGLLARRCVALDAAATGQLRLVHPGGPHPGVRPAWCTGVERDAVVAAMAVAVATLAPRVAGEARRVELAVPAAVLVPLTGWLLGYATLYTGGAGEPNQLAGAPLVLYSARLGLATEVAAQHSWLADHLGADGTAELIAFTTPTHLSPPLAEAMQKIDASLAAAASMCPFVWQVSAEVNDDGYRCWSQRQVVLDHVVL
jgi:hypothetical protein